MAGRRADWSRLTAWLNEQRGAVVTVSWAEFDAIVGGLPESAAKHYPQWWHGERPNTRAWHRAGYALERVDVGRSVTFRRTGAVIADPEKPRSPAVTPTSRHNDVSEAPDDDLEVLTGIDIDRALIVLPCSADKVKGGDSGQDALPGWPEALWEARDRLRLAAQVDESLQMPAWRRYTGRFYDEADDALSDAVAKGAHVVILSGGYGVVRAQERIGWYNRLLRLADWPPGLLEDVLTAEAARVRAQWVVAFAGASTSYARLVRRTPWRGAGVSEALLVTAVGVGGGAMSKVPPVLGKAFRAFWEERPDLYPPSIIVERIS